MTLATDVQKLEPGSIVELFELDLTPFGGDLLRFHAGTNGLLANVTWDGNVYTAFPVAASGFEFNGQGQAPRPKLMVSNVVGAITALVLQYEDLVGAKVTRRRTLAKYLDAVNFPARRNLLTNTEQFDSAVWTGAKSAGASVAVNTTTSPDGTITADTLTFAASSDYIYQLLTSYSAISGQSVTFSIYGKTATRLIIFGGASTSGVDVFSVVDVGGGWFRQVLTRTFSVTTSAGILQMLPIGSYVGVGSFPIWGAQLEAASTNSDYQPVGTTWSQNPTADPSAEFPADIFFIDRKSVETNEIVEFELAPAMDITGVMLPRRQIIQNICPWRYRSSECGYTGTNYFDANDVSVGTLALDVCGKRLGSCKARFGQYAELPFGGFPVAGLFR